ncbi:MAG: CARDB domain-containing protein [Panacagrimonas sp.]
MRHICFVGCAALALGLSACDVSVEGGLTGNLVETVRADLPPKTPAVTALASATACMPDTSTSDPDLVLEAPRINLTFCEFEEPLATDRFELRGLNAGQRYQVSTFNLAPLADTLIDIYDESGRSLAFNDDRDDFDRSSTLIFEATATTAIVEVRSRDQGVGPSRGYSLLATANVPVPSPPCSPDASEDNDTETAARSLGAATRDDGVALNFCEDAIDYFLLEVVPGESRQVNTFGLGVNADTVLEIFAGPSEAAGAIAFSDDAQGRGRASTVNFVAPPGVTSVLLKLSSFAGAIGDGHEYSLTTGIPPDQALRPDSFEENDTDAQPAELRLDGPTQGIALNFVDDSIDYFLLQVQGGTAYTTSTSGLEPSTDTVLEIFGGPTEASGLIALNDDTDTNGDGRTDNRASSVEFIVPAGVSTVLIKARQFNLASIGNGTGYRLAATRVAPDLSIAVGSAVFLPKGAELLSPRTFLGFSQVFNKSPNTARGQVAYILSADPVIDPSDLRIPGNPPPFSLAPFSSVPDFRNIALPATANGIFYLGASIETDSFVGETFESNNRQIILSPLKLSADNADNCVDDIADAEFLVGPGGPGSGGDDRAPSSPFLNDVNETQSTILHSHCVDSEDWSQVFSPAGQTLLITTTGLGTAGDTVVGLYRDRGDTLVVEGDDLVAGAGQARNSVLRFTHEQDEVFFVRATSRTGGGPNRGYFLNVVGEPIDTPLPDLVASIAAAPAAAAPGEIFQVTIEIRNLGAGTAPASMAQVGLACASADIAVTQQETVILLSDIRVPGLAPRSTSQPLARLVTIDPALLPAGFSGDCKLFAVADSGGQVIESVDDFGQAGIELPALGRFLNSSGDRAFSVMPAPGFALSRSSAYKAAPAIPAASPVRRTPPETGSTAR